MARAEAKATEGPAKAERLPLSRARIVEAALRVMDAEGLEAVTMRRIGRELGVEAMSLYNHVRDKDDLLEGVIEEVLSEFRYEPEGEDWLTQATAAASEWRRLLRAHPNVIGLLVERKHPRSSPEAIRPMEIAFELLRSAGLSEKDAVSAFRAIGSFIFGHVLMETGNIAPGPETIEEVEELRRFAAAEFPRFAELLPEMIACDMDQTFSFGLELLLRGLLARANELPAAT